METILTIEVNGTTSVQVFENDAVSAQQEIAYWQSQGIIPKVSEVNQRMVELKDEMETLDKSVSAKIKKAA